MSENVKVNEKQVLTVWNRCKSIKATARELNVSTGVIQKYLIGLGIYRTPRTERIAELRAAGMPPKDIAEFLGVSASTVAQNMPYTKGSYLKANKTLNAMRIRECRERKKAAE